MNHWVGQLASGSYLALCLVLGLVSGYYSYKSVYSFGEVNKQVEQASKRILSLALEALYLERQKIEGEISAIERQLRQGPKEKTGTRRSSKNRLSAAGRKAISDAMKRRWAARRALLSKKASKG